MHLFPRQLGVEVYRSSNHIDWNEVKIVSSLSSVVVRFYGDVGVLSAWSATHDSGGRSHDQLEEGSAVATRTIAHRLFADWTLR